MNTVKLVGLELFMMAIVLGAFFGTIAWIQAYADPVDVAIFRFATPAGIGIVLFFIVVLEGQMRDEKEISAASAVVTAFLLFASTGLWISFAVNALLHPIEHYEQTVTAFILLIAASATVTAVQQTRRYIASSLANRTATYVSLTLATVVITALTLVYLL